MDNNQLKKVYAGIAVLAALVLLSDAGGLYLFESMSSAGETSSAQMTADSNAKIAALQKQISGLESQLSTVGKQSAAAALSAQEVANRQAVASKSQSQLVTDAVAKVLPAVVSVIISKDVPQYQVTYQNPFGDDPFFQGFGVQVPVYTPTGKTESQTVGAGSGFLVSSDGYVATNRHVVTDTNASYTVLLSTGKQETATVVYRDPKYDIAILKIAGTGFPYASFGDSSALALGQTVVAIGNALGQYNNSVSVGVISGLNRTISASDENGNVETLTNVIQTDAAINPGNSGGPLVDLSGDVVGINVATVQGGSNVSFSLPINTVKTIIESAVK